MPAKSVPPEQLSRIKEALVNAGVLKTANLSDEDQANIAKELAKSGVSKDFPSRWVCHPNHICIVVPEE